MLTILSVLWSFSFKLLGSKISGRSLQTSLLTHLEASLLKVQGMAWRRPVYLYSKFVEVLNVCSATAGGRGRRANCISSSLATCIALFPTRA